MTPEFIQSLVSVFGGCGLLAAAFVYSFNEYRKENKQHMDTLTSSVTTTLDAGFKTYRDITHESLSQKDQQIQAIVGRLEVVEKTANNYKELADVSIADRTKLQTQINEIQLSQIERKQKIADLEKQITDLSKQVESKQLESEQLQSELTSIKTLYTNLSIEKKDLETVQAAKIDALEKRIVALEAKVEQQVKTIKDLEQANTDLSDALKQAQIERDKALRDLKDVQTERDNLKALLDSLAKVEPAPSVPTEVKP